MSTINPNEVTKTFLDCLFTDEEIKRTPTVVPAGAVVVQSITSMPGGMPYLVFKDKALKSECQKQALLDEKA